MGSRAGAKQRQWVIADASELNESITIRGWDWGGSGPLALLHHANGFCGATWSLVAEELRADYHVVAIDARGHGDSDDLPAPEGYVWDYFVADLTAIARALLQETGEPRIAYGIGSSFGGIVTTATEAANPGLFERIAMLDPPIHPTPELLETLGIAMPPESMERGATLVERTLNRRATWPSRDVVRDAWYDKPMFADWPTEAFELYLNEALRDLEDGQVTLKCPPAVEASIFETTGSIDMFSVAAKLELPVLLAHASKGMFPVPVFHRLANTFANGTYLAIPAGHLLPLEVPHLCVEALLDFATSS